MPIMLTNNNKDLWLCGTVNDLSMICGYRILIYKNDPYIRDLHDPGIPDNPDIPKICVPG